MKKIFCAIICFMTLISLTACSVVSYKRGKSDREEVVDMILEGDVQVEENGCILLPDGYKRLSDSGECFVVEFNGQTGVYFFTYRGAMTENSRGYVFVTQELDWRDYINTDKYLETMNWFDIEELDEGWYSVKA